MVCCLLKHAVKCGAELLTVLAELLGEGPSWTGAEAWVEVAELGSMRKERRRDEVAQRWGSFAALIAVQD